MKVLLTGATGFVGSHILDALCESGIPTAILLRAQSNTRFIKGRLSQVEQRSGSVEHPASLPDALRDITHVIHCAGCTKAIHSETYFKVNEGGTQHLVAAANGAGTQIKRLILISSLAASHPAMRSVPALETDPSVPVTVYGRSKRAGEVQVIEQCEADYVILRPAAVYGPRDGDFLAMFKTLRNGINPLFNQGAQELSLVFVKDVAAATLACLENPAASKQTFNIAAPEVITAAGMSDEIARQLGVKPKRIPLPLFALWLACVAGGIASRLTGRPGILSSQKFPELAASGWVCNVDKLRTTMGFTCPTSLREGITQTLAWYRAEKWL